MKKKEEKAPQEQEIIPSEEEKLAAKLSEEFEELQANYTRLAADFDNYRKRCQRQSQDIIARANEDLICKLLPVLDNFGLALDSLADPQVHKGMTMIHDQLMAALAAEGLSVIAASGCHFDPAVHEAVAHEQCPDSPDQVILAELRKGYMLAGKVLRPTAVKVNTKEDAI